ncbi:unnamed protein product [Gongylonema pulchrum]|uniref:Ovule protein n=1 Tax=Gongylonema pulchrum TaxID=637853 RepID=A0A183EIU8_9BILA|nr:unnamed protein product [Gongylonema pulchrum]
MMRNYESNQPLGNPVQMCKNQPQHRYTDLRFLSLHYLRISHTEEKETIKYIFVSLIRSQWAYIIPQIRKTLFI